MNQNELHGEFVEQRGVQPQHTDLFLWEGRVYQYWRLGLERGNWKYICPQIDETVGSSAFEFTLMDGILIRTSAERLIEILLRTHGGVDAQRAGELTRLFFGILLERGWTGPLMTIPTKIGGTVIVSGKETNDEIETDDIRPILVTLLDPSAHSVCVPESPSEGYPHGRFHRYDLLNVKVEVIPDEMSASEALAALREQDAPDRPVDKPST